MSWKRHLRKIMDPITLGLVSLPLCGGMVDYFTYQRKRMMRRALENRLRGEGLYRDEVQQGPFQGLRYPPKRWASGRFEKIIGAYERELFPWLQIISGKAYSDVVNIGTAEGYYAVGLAMLLPSVRVTGFELKAECREFLLEMATINGVADRISVHGGCALSDLENMRPGPFPLVVCDVEGYEGELLQPVRVPWLSQADLLVELHDERLPGVSDAIRERFAATHRIYHCLSAGLPYGEYPPLQSLTFREIYALVAEERLTLQHWFFLEHGHSIGD